MNTKSLVCNTVILPKFIKSYYVYQLYIKIIRPQHKTQQQPQPSLRQLMRNFKYWNAKVYLANFLFEHFFITQMLKNWLALNCELELIKIYWVIFGLYIIYFFKCMRDALCVCRQKIKLYSGVLSEM